MKNDKEERETMTIKLMTKNKSAEREGMRENEE